MSKIHKAFIEVVWEDPAKIPSNLKESQLKNWFVERIMQKLEGQADITTVKLVVSEKFAEIINK